MCMCVSVHALLVQHLRISNIWGFPKWGYPQLSSIQIGCSLIHSSIWGYPHDYGTLSKSEFSLVQLILSCFILAVCQVIALDHLGSTCFGVEKTLAALAISSGLEFEVQGLGLQGFAVLGSWGSGFIVFDSLKTMRLRRNLRLGWNNDCVVVETSGKLSHLSWIYLSINLI